MTDMKIDTAWTKRPINESHRLSLWRVIRLKLARFEYKPYEKYKANEELARDADTRAKYFALENLFWIRLSDFLDIIPRYSHLTGILLPTQPLALSSPGLELNAFNGNGIVSTQVNGHAASIPQNHLTNGYH